MQLVQMFKAILKPKYSVIAALAVVGVVATVFVLIPTSGEKNTLAQDCANPPSTPTFNYWPVTYDDVNTPFCHDFPAIDASIDTNSPVWSTSEADWNNGLDMTIGQIGNGGMYLHNGAANNLPLAQTTAKNVHIITHTDTSVGANHQISVTYTADNAASYTKSFTVHTPANARLEVIPNTGYIYDYQGRVVLDHQHLDLGNSDYALGNLDACFEYSLFLTYKFKVVASTVDTGTTLSIDKGVKNITVDPNTGRGSLYSASTNAKQNEQVGYRVLVTNTGSNVAQNVTMTDNSVSGISVNAGSTTVGTADDALLSSGWSGSIPGTISLGNLNPGESRIIKYTGRVTVASGTLVNTAVAVATNATQVQDTASVVVTSVPTGNPNLSIEKLVKNNNQNTAYGKTATVKTGEWAKFKVTITNTGNADLTGARITDSIPAGLQLDNASSTDASATISGNTITIIYTSAIPAGQSRSIEFAAQVTATGPASICNIANATGNNVGQVSDNACVTVPAPIIVGNPNLTITKLVKNNTTSGSYAKTATVSTGDRVNFKVTITNTGNADLTGAKITDAIPAGLQFADSVSTDGTSSFNSNTLTVTFANAIPAGQSKTVEFAATVTATTTSNICNTATGSGNSVTTVQDNACVNLTVIIVPPSNPKIAIKKYVKNNSTSGSYDDISVDARTGERVNFKITVTNPGDATLNNVKVTDVIPSGLQYDDSATGDGTRAINGSTFTVDFGSIAAGQSKTVEFAAQVLTPNVGNICNIAKATGTSVSEVQDSACVNVYTTPKPGSPNIVLSKKAFNNTKNVDATSTDAARGDYITYTLVTTNNGSADQTNYVITDDLSQVLPLADMVSTNGGTVSGNTITYPAITIKAGETVTKTFQVRIKQTLSSDLSYTLTNAYGNTIVIKVPGKIVYEAPTTGAAGTSAAAFAGLLTVGFVIARKRDAILKFILA